MGDRCYMELWCLRKHAARFEELGFTEQDEMLHLRGDAQSGPASAFVYMTDEEANYAHGGDLPEDVPFVATFSAGGSYGPGEIASDGQRMIEVATGHLGGYVVVFDAADNPDPDDLKHIRRFLRLRRRVERKILKMGQSTAP